MYKLFYLLQCCSVNPVATTNRRLRIQTVSNCRRHILQCHVTPHVTRLTLALITPSILSLIHI